MDKDIELTPTERKIAMSVKTIDESEDKDTLANAFTNLRKAVIKEYAVEGD